MGSAGKEGKKSIERGESKQEATLSLQPSQKFDSFNGDVTTLSNSLEFKIDHSYSNDQAVIMKSEMSPWPFGR